MYSLCSLPPGFWKFVVRIKVVVAEAIIVEIVERFDGFVRKKDAVLTWRWRRLQSGTRLVRRRGILSFHEVGGRGCDGCACAVTRDDLVLCVPF